MYKRQKEEIAKQLEAAIKKHQNDPDTALRNLNIGPVQVFSPAALEEIGEAFMLEPNKATALHYDSFESNYGRPGHRYNEERNKRLFNSSGEEVATGSFTLQPLSSLNEDELRTFKLNVGRALKINARGPRGAVEEYEVRRFLPKSMPQELKDFRF